jgi:hypothetical protein
MTAQEHQVDRTTTRRYWPIWVLISMNILIGLSIFRGYGVSIDEPANLRYARYIIDFYRTSPFSSYVPFNIGSLDFKGPAYFVIAGLMENIGRAFFPEVAAFAFWHLADFLVFQLAVFCIYRLALRWMDEWGAFGAALIFSTQPLLWGHAFINAKDSPFMVLFLAAVTSGLVMADHLAGMGPQLDWQALSVERQGQQRARNAKLLVGLGVLLILGLLAGAALFWRNQIMRALTQGVHGLPSDSALRAAYSYVANGPLSDFLRKYVVGGRAFLPGLILPVVVIVFVVVAAALLRLRWPDLANWFRKTFWASFKDWRVLSAGILLGLATSVRILGPYAGLLVMLWMLYRLRWRAVPPILAYLLIAYLAAYLTWPFLWGNPLARLLGATKLMSDYPWQGVQLFNGVLYPASERLPVSYVPTLMGIQLTEPVWFLFIIALALVAYRFAKNRTGLDLILLLLLWTVLPVVALVARHSTIYNNIRQLHFLFPPIFIYAGIAISFLLSRLKSRVLRLVLLLIMVAPGIAAIAHLYPYEYTYYNSLVGGPSGAFRRFETDYWTTSSTEAIRYINQVAAPGSTIVVTPPLFLFRPFARQDLELRRLLPGQTLRRSDDYLLISTKENQDLQPSLGSLPTLATIGRDGVLYMIIKKIVASP